MAKPSPVRIAIVEDDAGFRRRLGALIRGHDGWSLVGEFACADGLVAKLTPLHPDVVLLDIQLPGVSGLDAVGPLRRALPRTTLLVMLTVVEESAAIVEALRRGACAYLVKGTSASKLVAGIEDVIAEGAAISPAIARRIAAWFEQQEMGPESGAHGLTDREWQVLRLAARGRQQGEIALALGIAVNTVKNHCRHIYEKLGVHSMREALVVLNRGRGLLDRP